MVSEERESGLVSGSLGHTHTVTHTHHKAQTDCPDQTGQRSLTSSVWKRARGEEAQEWEWSCATHSVQSGDATERAVRAELAWPTDWFFVRGMQLVLCESSVRFYHQHSGLKWPQVDFQFFRTHVCICVIRPRSHSQQITKDRFQIISTRNFLFIFNLMIGFYPVFFIFFICFF